MNSHTAATTIDVVDGMASRPRGRRREDAIPSPLHSHILRRDTSSGGGRYRVMETPTTIPSVVATTTPATTTLTHDDDDDEKRTKSHQYGGGGGTVATTVVLPLKKRPYRTVVVDDVPDPPYDRATTHRDIDTVTRGASDKDDDHYHPDAPPTKLRRLVASYWSRHSGPEEQCHGDDWDHSRTTAATTATHHTTATTSILQPPTATRARRHVDWNEITKQAPASGSYHYEEQYDERMTVTSTPTTPTSRVSIPHHHHHHQQQQDEPRFRYGSSSLDQDRKAPLRTDPEPRPPPPNVALSTEPSRAMNHTNGGALVAVRPLDRHFIVPVTDTHPQQLLRWIPNAVADHIPTKDEDDHNRTPRAPSSTVQESTFPLPQVSFRHVDSTIFMDQDNVDDDEELVEMEATVAATSGLDSPTSSFIAAYHLPSITPSPNPTQQRSQGVVVALDDTNDTTHQQQQHSRRPLPIVPDALGSDTAVSSIPSVSMMTLASRTTEYDDSFDVYPTPLRREGEVDTTRNSRSAFWTAPTNHAHRNVVVPLNNNSSSNRPGGLFGTPMDHYTMTVRASTQPQVLSPSDIIPGFVVTLNDNDARQPRAPMTHQTVMTTTSSICPTGFDSVATANRLYASTKQQHKKQRSLHHAVNTGHALTTPASFIPHRLRMNDPLVPEDRPPSTTRGERSAGNGSTMNPERQRCIERSTERVESTVSNGKQQQQPPPCQKPEYELNFPPDEPVRSETTTSATLNNSIEACSSSRTDMNDTTATAGYLTTTSSLSTSSGLSHSTTPATETTAAIAYPTQYNLPCSTTTKRQGLHHPPHAYDHPLYTSHLAASGRRVQSAFAPGRVMKTPRHLYERTEI